MPAPPKLDRNRRIARAAINGASLGELAKLYKVRIQTIKAAIRVAVKYYAPDFETDSVVALRAVRDEVLPLLSGEVITPENRAEVLDRASDPWGNLMKAAKSCGLNPSATEKLIRRMQKFDPVIKAARQIKTEHLQEMLDEKAYLALAHMDEVTFAKADLATLGKTAGVLIDKRQLLRGEPTQIMGHNDRKKLDDIAGLLLKEAQRRGVVVDAEYTVVNA